MTSTLPPAIAIGGVEYVEKFTGVAAAAFAADPFTRRFISENDNLQAAAILTPSRLYEHFLPLIKGSAESGAELVEAGDWAGIALWYLVSSHLKEDHVADFDSERVPPIPKTPTAPENLTKVFRPALGEYVAKCLAMKQQHLGGRPYWYLNIIGRNPDMNCPGKFHYSS